MCDQHEKPLETNFASKHEPPSQEEELPLKEVKEASKAIFTVMIVGTRGVRNADGLPGFLHHCCCDVRRGNTLLHKTRTVDNSLAAWAEEFGVCEYEIGESLEFKVRDGNAGPCLGKVTLTPQEFMENGCSMEFPLEDTAPNIRAYLGLKIKVAGQEQYPDSATSEFEVTVEKQGAKEYGLDLDCQDVKTVQILKVVDGAFKRYNGQVKPPLQVIPSDFIVAVNGVTGGQMLKQFQADQVTLTLARAFHTVVSVQAGKTKQHGLKFPVQLKNCQLKVADIGDGYIKEHNSKCEDESQKILVHDRIVSVNGRVGTAATLKSKLTKATGKLQLGIQRPCLN